MASSSACWTVVNVQGTNFLVDSSGRVVSPEASHAAHKACLPVQLRKDVNTKSEDAASGCSHMSRRRQALARQLMRESTETISNSGTDVSWWHARVLDNPEHPANMNPVQDVPEIFDMSMDDLGDDATAHFLEDEVPEDQVPTAAAATQAPPNLPTKTEAALQAPAPTPTAHPLQGRTPLADTSMQALVVLRQHWAGLKGKLHARKVRMQQDPKHLQKLSAVDRWDHLVLWKWKQREFANYTDLLKLLKRDRDSEQLTSQLPAKTRPKK